MKVRINENGELELNRKGRMVPQACPYSSTGEECGDWCPLFGEPDLKVGAINTIRLELCHKVFDFAVPNFTDERGQS